MASPNKVIRALEQQRGSLDKAYSEWEPHFRDLRDAILPSRGQFTVSGQRAAPGINKRIIDSTAARAHRTLRAGLMSGMTSPQRPWFILGLYDDELAAKPEVKQYLETVQKRMYTVLRGSNIYRTFDACYADVGLFGTFCGIIVGHPTKIIETKAFPMGSYRIGEGANGEVDMLHFDSRQSVKQVVDRFGFDNCSDYVKRAFEKGQLSDWVEISSAIIPREVRRPDSPLSKDMPVASYHWEKKKNNKLLMESGFNMNPILGPRWEQVIGQTYSVSSPGMMAIGDAVQLQGQHREKALAVQMMVRPPMQAPAGFKSKHRGVPGGVTTMDSQDLQKGGLRPTHQVQPDITALAHDIQETRIRIGEAFFEDLFMLTIQSDRRQVTATEIAERHEEKLVVLGPVLEALTHLLQQVVETTFHYMQEAAMLPPAPDGLDGAPLKIEYVSLLAQAQKMVGTAPIERMLGFAGSIAQVKPQALDLIDEDEAVREFADKIGAPVKMIRDEKTVAGIREARQQEMATQAAMEQAEPMANAARLISEASARSEETLQNQRNVI